MKKIFVVGIGPGDYEQMTIRAVKVLEISQVIVGYTTYVKLLEDHFPSKKWVTTPMRREEERCQMAFEEAKKGQIVSVICSGDAGVYGMAGLMCGMSEDYSDFEIEVVGGVTAALSGAALLGAPLMHDFAVISLSDLLTPWELIKQRLAAAAMADMGICLYNPSSKKRKDYLHRACEIILQYASADTVCGVVRCVGREGEEKELMTLGELMMYEADMFTTVFVGNSTTKRVGKYMVTPRGYLSERGDI